jgi:hypothetical protein
MTNTTITLKNIGELAPDYTIPAGAPREVKQTVAERFVNQSRYNILGFLDRTNELVLEARYHNVRDARGRFARVRQTR